MNKESMLPSSRLDASFSVKTSCVLAPVARFFYAENPRRGAEASPFLEPSSIRKVEPIRGTTLAAVSSSKRTTFLGLSDKAFPGFRSAAAPSFS
jgi:hypothetical protein